MGRVLAVALAEASETGQPDASPRHSWGEAEPPKDHRLVLAQIDPGQNKSHARKMDQCNDLAI